MARLETCLWAAREASREADRADMAQLYTWKLDDGTRRAKETPKMEAARLRYSIRRRRQATHLWDMIWRRIDG